MSPEVILALAVLVGTAIIGTIGYFFRQTLEDIKTQLKEAREENKNQLTTSQDERNKLESKITSHVVQIRNEVSEIEKLALGFKGTLFEELKNLHEDFVPRRELTEIVRGMRETAELNAKVAREAVANNTNATLEISKKLDGILLALANRKEP